jgi:hypothetical protein
MKRLLLITMILAAILAGCTQPAPPETTTPATTTVPEPTVSAEALYQTARLAVENAENLVLTYTLDKEKTVGENHFAEKIEGNTSISDVGRKNMTAVVEQTIDFGVYDCKYAETFCEGEAYVVVNGCRFRTTLAPEEFVKRQIQPVLIDESLYAGIECVAGEDTTAIYFTEARSLESWVGEGELIEASGSAILDNTGRLMQTEYAVSYRVDGTEFTLKAKVEIKTPEGLDLGAIHIGHELESIPISSIDAPRALVKTVADIYAATALTCEMTERIHSEALPLTYTQKTQLKLRGFGEEMEAEVLYDVSLSDYRGSVSERQQEEQFHEGMYSVSVDGGEAIPNPEIMAETMRRYCEDVMLSGLFAMKYLQEAEVATAEGRIRFTFTGNGAFCADLMKELSEFLQVDLDEKAQSSETLAAGGYLELDASTGLPVAMGMELERSHALDGVRYVLQYHLDEAFSFAAE